MHEGIYTFSQTQGLVGLPVTHNAIHLSLIARQRNEKNFEQYFLFRLW